MPHIVAVVGHRAVGGVETVVSAVQNGLGAYELQRFAPPSPVVGIGGRIVIEEEIAAVAPHVGIIGNIDGAVRRARRFFRHENAARVEQAAAVPARETDKEVALTIEHLEIVVV